MDETAKPALGPRTTCMCGCVMERIENSLVWRIIRLCEDHTTPKEPAS